MESDYCILPYPKYDEAQDSYGTYLQDGHSIICVPITAKDPAMVSACIEALAAEGFRTVFPAFYDTVMSHKYTRDEESVEMLDIVRSSVWYNFGYVYCMDALFTPRNMLGQHSSDFASYYKKNQKLWEKKLDRIMKQFEDMEN